MRSLPARSAVADNAKWDLSQLYAGPSEWDRDLAVLEKESRKYAQFSGRFSQGAEVLADCLRLDSWVKRRMDRLRAYAYLRAAEDQTDSFGQRLLGRIQAMSTRVNESASFMGPEIMAMSPSRSDRYLKSPALGEFRVRLERILRYRPHTLTRAEERLLAMQGEMSQTASRTFRQLLDADLRFGRLDDGTGKERELTHSTLRQFLQSPRRSVRKRAFHQYYAQIVQHEHTLAATLSGSVQRDIYYARARGYPSALAASLFHDDVPLEVYQQLIATVRRYLPALHRYLEIRRRRLKLKTIHQYDLDPPLVPDVRWRHTWDQAVGLILESLEPLGDDYIRTLEHGLRGRWCDRYPNRGKQSGAFSYGIYDAEPFILMNYKPDVLEDVFTLAHEAGHAMHSYLSARRQPYETFDYSIFVAEVASTFNEQLLSQHLQRSARESGERAYLIHREIDAIRSTILRQTMFAEFELKIHEASEQGEPLTVAFLTDTYSQLLRDYFGAGFTIDPELHREGLRIPHFYRPFYVYLYATGLAAAFALSQQVLTGQPQARQRYLEFLGSGSSKFPLELLRDAGVDMRQSQPVELALQRFERLVTELDSLLE